MSRHPSREVPAATPAERVRLALEQDPDVRGERILVDADDANVVLRGHVIDEEEHRRTLEAAARGLDSDRIRDDLEVHWMRAVKATAWAGYVEEQLRGLDRRLAGVPLRIAATGDCLEIWGRVPDETLRDRILRVVSGLRVPRILDRVIVQPGD